MALNTLPDGWEWKALGEVAQFVPGVAYGKADVSHLKRDGFTLLLRANNIQKKVVADQDLVFVPSSMVRPGQLLLEGDILIAKYSGSRDLVGKSARLDFGTVATFGTFCGVVRVKNGVDSRFIAHFFQSPAYREKISAISQGAAIGNLRKENLENLTVPLPRDMAEQARLVSKIDAVLSFLDGAIAVQKNNLHRTTGLRQSLLAEVFTPMKGQAVSRPLSFFGKISPGGTPPRQTAAYWKGEIDWFTSGELNTHTVRESK